MAKNAYGAEKVITTVSTRKIPMIDGFLSKGVVDESEFPAPETRESC